MKNLFQFNLKIKNKDGITMFSTKDLRIEQGTIVIPYKAKSGKEKEQYLFKNEFNWFKCNKTYVGKPKIDNGKYITLIPVKINNKGGER